MKKHMKSRWYEEQVKEGFEARLENKNKTPKTMIGMAVFFIVIFVILYVVHVNDPNYEFDMEMYSAPEKVLINKTNERLFVTPHYLVDKGVLMGAPVYTVACRDEIKSIRYCSSRNHSKLSPLARLYDVDLLDANEKKIGGLTLEGKDMLNKLKQVLNMED